MNPSGYMPGFHIPGTLVPIGAVMAGQAAAQTTTTSFLLLLSSSGRMAQGDQAENGRA